jgi:hypothetical protein
MEKDEIKECLDKEIEREINEMHLLWANPKEEGYTNATERLAKLYKIRADEKQAEREALAKSEQLAEAKKDRWIRFGVDTAGILLPLGFYAVWMRRGLKFEETGSFTSTTFRGLFNRFRPTR